MSWRAPRFAYIHAARDIGVANMTADATVDADYPLANLIDDRPSVRFKWSNSTTNHNIDVDLGAGFVTGIDRLWIPNHNITGDYTVEEDDNAGFASATSLGTGSMVSGTDLDKVLTASTERYLRFTITTAGAWELGQLMFTETVTLTAGMEPGPAGWPDERFPNVIQLPGGDSLQTDPDQRFFEFRYPLLGDAAATDLTKMEALFAAVSTYRPFLLDPPYDTEAALLVKLAERPRVQVNPLVPASETRKADVRFSLLEYLG